MKKAIVSITVKEATPNGGSITISTPTLDRDRDHVMPLGARIDNYMKNPVVQWGHNYFEPWATIGKTTALKVSAEGIDAEFVLRDPVNDTDPQNIVKLLWAQGFIKAASIGFNPNQEEITENDEGGLDFNDWELLEWSLVPVPANQEALRNSVKALLGGDDTLTPSFFAKIKAALILDQERKDLTASIVDEILKDDPPPAVEPEPEEAQPPEPTTEDDDDPPLTDEEMERLVAAIEAWLSAIQESTGEPS